MIYSHSRLSTYEQCPYKFKLRYIDKVIPDEKQTIEAFLGNRVHETLEKLYKDLLYQKENNIEDLINFLKQKWAELWEDSIIIVKDQYTMENYLSMAERYVTDYYKTYYPFRQERTISLEQRVMITLDKTGDYQLQGYIDRLAEKKPGQYEIHDYKTNMRLPLPEYIRSDRQLALYSIGIKDQYPDVKDVRLIWHFLAFNKEIDSTRTDEELEKLKRETIKLIDIIESTEIYQTKPSLLCQWCEFKPICRQWSHLYKLKERPNNEYLGDPGKQLVDRYVKLKQKTQQLRLDLYAEMEKLEEAIIAFAEKEDIDVVFGSENKIQISTHARYALPKIGSRKRDELEKALQNIGKYQEVLNLDTTTFNNALLEKRWNEEDMKHILPFVSLETKKRLFLSTYNQDP